MPYAVRRFRCSLHLCNAWLRILPPFPWRRRAAAQALSRLNMLDVPASTYWRMTRWSVTDVLKELPNCEVQTSVQ